MTLSRLLLTAALLMAAAPPGAMAQSYGAIAYSPVAGEWGWARNHRSRLAAEGAALAQCRAAAGRGCRVAVWFENACGALATGAAGFGAGWAGAQAQAEGSALAACRAQTGQCQVRLRFCTG